MLIIVDFFEYVEISGDDIYFFFFLDQKYSF